MARYDNKMLAKPVQYKLTRGSVPRQSYNKKLERTKCNKIII